MTLRGGELALIDVSELDQASAFADACAGLISPSMGAVCFLGRDWTRLPARTADALRGRIGRLFCRGNWLDHLSLLENILLPALHHTHRPLAELRDEAARLARRFSLPGVPVGRPGEFMQSDLQRAACVRAFLGNPAMIILEEPTAAVYPDIMPVLVNTMREARNRGAAVIWLVEDNKVWRDPSIPATHRYRMAAHELVEVARRT